MGKKRHEEHEEHVNHERWLVTYADMITLLMVLFIVLFAMSTVDQKKFNALKSGLAAGFGQSTSILDGSSSILSEPGTAATMPINPNKIQDNPQIDEIKQNAVTSAMAQQNQRAYAGAAAEADRLVAIQKRVRAALKKHGLADDVSTKIDGRGLTVSMVSRHIVFQSNLADLTPRGLQILNVLGPVLKTLPDRMQIEGHTNQAAGKPKYYASDWDLSSARAVTVLRYLNEHLGVPADKLAAVGFGHIKPLVDPAQPGSQELNKRVDIVVMSALSNETGALLDRVIYDRARDKAAAAKKATESASTSAPKSAEKTTARTTTKSAPSTAQEKP